MGKRSGILAMAIGMSMQGIVNIGERAFAGNTLLQTLQHSYHYASTNGGRSSNAARSKRIARKRKNIRARSSKRS